MVVGCTPAYRYEVVDFEAVQGMAADEVGFVAGLQDLARRREELRQLDEVLEGRGADVVDCGVVDLGSLAVEAWF